MAVGQGRWGLSFGPRNSNTTNQLIWFNRYGDLWVFVISAFSLSRAEICSLLYPALPRGKELVNHNAKMKTKKKKEILKHLHEVRESRAPLTQGMAKEEREGIQWLRRHHALDGLSRSRVCSLGILASSTAGRLPKRSVEDLPARFEMDGRDSVFLVQEPCSGLFFLWLL